MNLILIPDAELLRALQRLRPAVLRGSVDGRRHSALTSFTAAEALLEEDPRFSRAPRFDRCGEAHATSIPGDLAW